MAALFPIILGSLYSGSWLFRCSLINWLWLLFLSVCISFTNFVHKIKWKFSSKASIQLFRKQQTQLENKLIVEGTLFMNFLHFRTKYLAINTSNSNWIRNWTAILCQNQNFKLVFELNFKIFTSLISLKYNLITSFKKL